MSKISKSKVTLSAACLLAATVAANASPYVLTLDQVGSNIVATGSGEFDLAGLTPEGGTSFAISAFTNPSFGWILTGPAGGVDEYGGLSGPSAFGSGSFSAASGASGNAVALQAFPNEVLLVSTGYKSGTALSDSATYNNATFAGLGLTTGTYEWTWGTRADQSFTLEIGQTRISATPIPAAFPLLASGLGVFGLFGWRRKRKLQLVS